MGERDGTDRDADSTPEDADSTPEDADSSPEDAEPTPQDDVDPADAFAALSDPVRVAVLEAFVDRYRERPNEQAVPFSTLRRAVGVRDSGRFRYHLERLRGVFVEKADDGYRLTYAGNEVTNAIVAGTYTGRERLGPVELEETCPFCDAPPEAGYEDGVLSVACGEGHPLFYWTLPPNAAEGASIEDLLDLATTLAYHSYELVSGGTCPDCYSPVEPSIRAVDGAGGQPYRFVADCGACGSTWDGPVGFVLIGRPEVEALYLRHGRSVREEYWWDLPFVRDDAPIERVGTDPLRLRLSVDVADETLEATVDEAGRVVETAHVSDG